jgi:hypothetical protein
VPRLVIVVASVLLAFPAAARADFSVSWTRLTNDPAVTITSDGPTECSLDGAAFAPCASPWRPAVGADRVYAFEVKSGAVSTGGSFTLDRTPPAIAVALETSGRAIHYSFSATDDHPGGIDCTWDGAAAPCSNSLDNLVDGVHTVVAHAVDAAGNEATVTRSVTVVQPQVTHVDPKPEGGVLSTTASSPSARLNSTHTKRWTRLHSLSIRDVEAGTALKATCKGKGCPKRALRITAKKAGTVSLAGLTGRKLSPGTVIKITLTRGGRVIKTFTISIRSRRTPLIR